MPAHGARKHKLCKRGCSKIIASKSHGNAQFVVSHAVQEWLIKIGSGHDRVSEHKACFRDIR